MNLLFQTLSTYFCSNKTDKMASNHDYLFKIVIIGNTRVGKSAILSQYCNQNFDDHYVSTSKIDFKIRHLQINEKKIKLQMWDTSGRESFNLIASVYYKGAHGVFLAYDVSDLNSFTNLKYWVKNVKRNCFSDPVLYVIGNKSDLKREVTQEQGQTFADDIGAKFSEVSAKLGINVEQSFIMMSSELLLKCDITTQKKFWNKCCII